MMKQDAFGFTYFTKEIPFQKCPSGHKALLFIFPLLIITALNNWLPDLLHTINALLNRKSTFSVADVTLNIDGTWLIMEKFLFY